MSSQLLPADKVVSVCKVLGSVTSTVVKLLKGGSIFGAIGLVGDISELKGLNPEQLKDQMKDLDKDERVACLQAFKSTLVLEDKKLEQKIESGADCLDEVVDVAFEAVAVYQHAVAVVEKVKGLVGEGVV